jgi:hypothetical protein
MESVHTVADVDNDADRAGLDLLPGHADPQRQIVKKGKHPITQANGEVVTQEIQYRGSKSHVSLNVVTGLMAVTIESEQVTAIDHERRPSQ